MKKFIIIILLSLPLIGTAQCPEITDTKALIAKAEEYLHTSFGKSGIPPQGTDLVLRDSANLSSITVETTQDGTVRKVIIMGTEEAVKKLFSGYFLSLPAECVESKGSAFVKAAGYEITLQEGSYNRGQKRYTASVWIVRK